MNIALLLEMAAEAAPDRVGLVCEGKRWTYGDLLAAARGAFELIRQSEAEYVALLDESSEAAVIAVFGAALAGVPYCPLNYRLPDADLAALLGRISPALVIGDEERITRLGGDQQHIVLSREEFALKAQETVPADDAREYDPGADEAGSGVAIQLFTSGTTAAPKAAILRHSNLLGYILGTIEFGSADEADAALVVVPPYHIAGISALLSSIYALRTIVMLPAFSPEGWLELVASERVSNAFVVPTMLSRIIEAMERAEKSDVSSLRAVAYGGGKMPIEVIRKALDLFPTAGFTNAYGLTETSSTVALLGPDDHREALASQDPKVRARLTSLGKPIPTVEIEIRGESGEVLPAGEPGEIYVRGEQVSGEYKEKSALDAQGWFPTRDAGYMDEDGYLFLSGRADDVIVRGGENMSPGEIEDVLLTHPAVADACACAIPSIEWGETVGVAIVTRDGHTAPAEAEIKDLVRARLRSSRVPEKIVFVAELPYNEMGKLLRRKVKEVLAD
ncbi:class I adenylate-forming enzyme family protein [Novosphingobium sp. ST904]|uniref:class I adenylate-forming enzyme family protein n=1 Tax=Novosphingobium sp. ST904 TaxID=1684385 RepID=UPI0006C831D2|nr:class I adenylate-forming enzyme family protein [Novosphingobium sp. ST904]KPH58683.1 AMP-dependent synthetase [Novosphingobium sp. ST904]TCM42147.1 acyl-CoA synthetase (AMP-forming)/AMP-acid ligase II [Novosphingobium sp. ST904]